MIIASGRQVGMYDLNLHAVYTVSYKLTKSLGASVISYLTYMYRASSAFPAGY